MPSIIKKERITADRLNKLGPEFYIVYINMRIVSYINKEFNGSTEQENIKKYRYLIEQKLNKTKIQSEKNRNGKLANIPISKTTVKITNAALAGGAAFYVGGHVTGAATKIIAPAANSLVKVSMRNAFGIFSDISAPLSYVANQTNNLIGGVVSKLVAGVIPIPLLYISILEFSKLFFFGIGKAQHFLKKKFMAKAEVLSFLPKEGPMLVLICNLSTLTVLNELITALKISNLKNIKFNFFTFIK